MKEKKDKEERSQFAPAAVEGETGLSSVKLVKTSKGVNVEVKVYDQDVAHAAKNAQETFDTLNKKYNQGQ